MNNMKNQYLYSYFSLEVHSVLAPNSELKMEKCSCLADCCLYFKDRESGDKQSWQKNVFSIMRISLNIHCMYTIGLKHNIINYLCRHDMLKRDWYSHSY
jgi:hypothetical protein